MRAGPFGVGCVPATVERYSLTTRIAFFESTFSLPTTL